jgi:hypothetical protein
MQIDDIIKAGFEREIEENRFKTTPFPNYIPNDSGEQTISKSHRSRFLEIGLAACFIIVFSISVFFKDDVYISPLVNQGASIAQLFPENPGKAFYDFILAIHSSF